jgi:hypothetical protein
MSNRRSFFSKLFGFVTAAGRQAESSGGEKTFVLTRDEIEKARSWQIAASAELAVHQAELDRIDSIPRQAFA